MGCKNAVLPEPTLRNGTRNCLTIEENTRQPYNNNMCLFRALAFHFHGNQRLEKEISKTFNSFVNKMDGLSSSQFKGVHMNDIPVVEDLLTLNFLLYDIDFVDGNIIGELAIRSVQKYDSTVRLLRYNNHFCYANNTNAVLQSFQCRNCDTFFNRIFNIEPHLTTCSGRVKNVYPNNVYQTQETLFDKLVSFLIEHTNEQTLFKNLALFDFESICVQVKSFKDTDTTKEVRKNLPIAVSISSNLVKEPISPCNSGPHHWLLLLLVLLKI